MRWYRLFIAFSLIVVFFTLYDVLRLSHRIPEGRLILWTASLKPYFNDYVENMLEDFSTKTGIEVEWVDVPLSSMPQKFVASVLAGDSPDVINLPVSTLYEFYYKGLIQEISSDRIDNRYLPQTLKALSVGNKLIGVPWYINVKMLMCNSRVLKEVGADVPDSLDELVELNTRLKGEGLRGTWFYVKFEQDAQAYAGPFCRFGTLSFNTLGLTGFISKLKGWYERGLLDLSFVSGNFSDALALFLQGRTGCIVVGPQFISRVKSESPKVYRELLVAPLPYRRPPITMMTLAIVKGAKPDALSLAEHISSTRWQLRLSELAPVLPSTYDGLEDITSRCGSEKSAEGVARCISAKQALRGEVYELRLPLTRSRGRIYKSLLYKVLEGELKPAEFPEELSSRLKKLYSSYGYDWGELRRSACSK